MSEPTARFEHLPWSISVRVKEYPEPLTWIERGRRWLYLRFGWRRLFRERDWMTMLQMLLSTSRSAHRIMAERIVVPFFTPTPANHKATRSPRNAP